MPKSNLCIIGLSKQFVDDICKQLSDRLEMYYANVEQIMEFELMDLHKVEEICGKEYLLKEEISIIKRVSSYENTLLNVEYSHLNNESSLLAIRENCLLIYLRLTSARFDKEQSRENVSENVRKINKDVMEDRDFICKNISDVTINCGNHSDSDLIDKIIEQIVEYYS